MPTHRSAVNQVIQLGVEVTPNTAVACNRLITAWTWTFGGKPVTKQFRGTGRQYPSASALLTEMSEGKISGPGDFAQLAYPVSSVFGKVTPTAHVNSQAAFDYAWVPPLTGSYVNNAQTYTLQNGDVNDAEQYAGGLFTGFGYSFTRQQEVAITGDWFAQTFTDGVALTASPTAVQQLPTTGAQFSVFLDAVSGNIGNTQLNNPMKVDFAASGYYAPFWPINRTNASFTAALDQEKKNELKLMLEADTTGIAIRGNYLEIGQRAYVRVAGVGQLIENDQIVSLGSPSAGTFTLTYKGQTTAGIAFNATAAAVQSALALLSSIPSGSVNVTGAAGGPYIVKFQGVLANDLTALTGSGTGLTGGTFSITADPINALMTHDMAVFVSAMQPFADQDKVYAVEYTMEVAEDTTWSTGTAQKFNLTNLLSGL